MKCQKTGTNKDWIIISICKREATYEADTFLGKIFYCKRCSGKRKKSLYVSNITKIVTDELSD